jgi:AraC-like DNA-binding protein
MTFTAGAHSTRTMSPRPRSWARASPLGVDAWLFEREPPPDLAEQLSCTWRGDADEAWTLLPDECVDMYWVNGSVWLSGPETRSRSSAAAAGTDEVGVRFRPGMAPSLLGVAASELHDQRVRLDQVWGDRAARELTERVSCRDDDEGRAVELENAVRQMAVAPWRPDAVALEVAGRMDQARTISAWELARATQLSERQLQRRCSIAFGYGPAFLLRINRVQRFLQLARDESRGPSLAGLAVAAGYADQSHLTREVGSIMGTTPAQLVRKSPECPIGSRLSAAPGGTLLV